MEGQENVGALVEEYRSLLANQNVDDVDSLTEQLIQSGGWSPQAAEHILSLARRYGSFMLRNALAVSLTLDIEDGELGF